MSLSMVSALLRAPDTVAAQCVEDRDMRALALTSLGVIAAGAMSFGAVVGSFRGAEQIALAAGKLPVAQLLTLALCAPAFHVISVWRGRGWPLRVVASLTLASAARASLVLLALAPLLWILIDLGVGYHLTALLAAGSYGLSLLLGVGVLLKALRSSGGRGLPTVGFAIVFLLVGGQVSWLLRPYLTRPRAEEVVVVREREGDFARALWMSARSSLGIYDIRPGEGGSRRDAY